jgi:hypothetical protein
VHGELARAQPRHRHRRLVESIKRQAIANRRLQHQLQAPMSQNLPS